MAAKVIFLLALTAVVVCAENDCTCDPNTEVENKALWKFLTKLSTGADDPQDKEMKAVLPGVLSPLLECNCLENNRRKRRILVEEETTEKLESLDSEEGDELEHIVQYNTNRCPKGHVWIAIKCVNVNQLKRISPKFE